ncbi:MAG: glycosyltransferase family 4 protein [Chloroflexi bacterium]|nr:glycosyltransferase family 4 protein [Chloroflexota bacterium]MCY3583168.1 glycosyltransferase family 4 protein [Chloroflexota bacterium]MCY3715344.1 glycosyltransferase family 4 protein [Chloroflexota bacterium]MDE2649553.1 glycosyltransferase family 4 protein [Chloroflexota bacterium]
MATAGQAAGGERRKLKILMLLLYYHPHSTGLTNYVRMLAEALARRGHEVTVVASQHTKALPRGESMLNGVRVVRLWAPLRISRGFILPTYPWQVYSLIRQHDIVNIHIPLLETALVAFLAGLAGVKLIATHHGDLILPAGRFNRFVTRSMFAMYKLMARRSACLVGYSDDYADNSYYLKPFRDQVRVIYPPVQIPVPDQEKAKQWRARWQQDGGAIIGFSGRFVQEKRPDLLIRALEIINKRYPQARIVFAGEYDIPYEGTWQRHSALVDKYREQLIFLGLLRDPQELANFYAACDVLALPSDSDCFALVQVEAMLCGTPVVMTDIPGGRVPVQVTGMGALAQAGDAISFGEAVLAVLADRAKYSKPRAEIARVFSFDKTLREYEQMFLQHARKR